MVRILPNQSHPLTKFLLDKEIREEILKVLGQETPLFTINNYNSQRVKIESTNCEEDKLKSHSFSCKLQEDSLIKFLKNGSINKIKTFM